MFLLHPVYSVLINTPLDVCSQKKFDQDPVVFEIVLESLNGFEICRFDGDLLITLIPGCLASICAFLLAVTSSVLPVPRWLVPVLARFLS